MTKLNADMKAGTDAATVTDVQVKQVSPSIANAMLFAALSIEEANLLISEFLEDEINANRTEVYPKGSYGCGGCYSVENLRYHYSWDWLMQVVEKIENLKNEEKCFAFSVDTGRDYCLIYHNDFIQRTISVKSFSGSKIKSVWLAVVEFIKWYNDNAVSVGSR